jgi:hypothetical protein
MPAREVARQGQLEAGPQGVALDGGEGWLLQPGEDAVGVLGHLDEGTELGSRHRCQRSELGQETQVDARAERLPFTRQQDSVHVWIRRRLLSRVGDLDEHLAVHRVALVGSSERDHRDPVASLVSNGLEFGHASTSRGGGDERYTIRGWTLPRL